ncbi:MAG TPA: restriction endonuclease subunit S [bacterium]|nr:restriction endonuclease subunit S [bacterium]HPN29343.1 restriction endonuclease subunit S [bacterium]
MKDRFDPLFYSGWLLGFFKKLKFKTVKLKDLTLYLKNGFAAGHNDQSFNENDIIQIRPTNINSDNMLVFDKNIYISRKTLNLKKSDVLIKNEILFNNTNSQELVGKTSFFDFDSINFCSNHITRIMCGNKILPKYLWIILNFYQKNKIFFNLCTNWNNQSGVNINVLANLLIPLPEKNTQEKIISIFEKSIINKQSKESKAQKMLDGIDDYLLSELGIKLPKEKPNILKNRIFKTSVKNISGGRFDPIYNDIYYLKFEESIKQSKYKLKKIFELCYGKSGVVYSVNDEAKDGKGILRANNIDLSTNELNLSDIKFISNNIFISSDLLLKKNDILMCSASGSKEHVGKVAYICEDLNLYFGGFMMVLRGKTSMLLSKYLFEFLRSLFFRKYLFRQLGGTNINNLNFHMISNLFIPLPPIDVQNKIAEAIKKIREEAKRLRFEASSELENAKKEIERMLLK